ncbi:hypothetical protein ACFPAF_04300 [Hymenobacter endophyticus]|uniref:Uncharacterized protein n=1 Tax=Hymenobacter endophyticus TaxID=3076335 RepID=A0ABU3TDZ2_9BACT|nr:hypothetical protein [Hymenobacter endophyticus]MDU0369606.1 hypothetical protein [Hymenobacter endophyticus]
MLLSLTTGPVAAAFYLVAPALAVLLAAWFFVRKPILKALLIIPAAGYGLWQVANLVDDLGGYRARRHYAQVQKALRRPAEWDRITQLSGEQAIIAASLTAEGLADYAARFPASRQESRQLTENLLLVLTGPGHCPFENVFDTTAWATREHNLYLSHLNVVLGCYARLGTASPTAQPRLRYQQLHDQLTRYLIRRLSAALGHNAPSYGDNGGMLWVADNAVTLHSIYLHNTATPPRAATLLSEEWVRHLLRTATHPSGLPLSELCDQVEPRGCANAWMAKYVRTYAPAYSRQLWEQHKQTMKRNFGMAAGFREYLPQSTLQPDYDSGPIVFGLGAAATGLALCGARYQGDYYTYYQILNAVQLTEAALRCLSLLAPGDEWAQAADSWLAQAIQFNAAAHLTTD